MRFRTGFCVRYNLKRELIMDGGLVAHFYVRHDTFATDLIAALPSVAEVSLLASALPCPALPCRPHCPSACFIAACPSAAEVSPRTNPASQKQFSCWV